MNKFFTHNKKKSTRTKIMRNLNILQKKKNVCRKLEKEKFLRIKFVIILYSSSTYIVNPSKRNKIGYVYCIW